MTTYFVSRHPGARDWATRRRLVVDRFVSHLDPGEVEAGDWVIGSLPVSLAAEVCARGGRYFHLSVVVTEKQRGTELTADDLDRLGAGLQEYRIQWVNQEST